MLSVDSPNNCNTALQDKLQVCESIVHIQCCLLTVPTIATLHYKTNYKFVNPLFIFNVVCWQYQQLQHYITRHTRSLWIHCSCQCCLLTVPTIATLHYKTNQKFVNPLFIFNVVCWQYQQLQHCITRQTTSLWIHCSYSMLSVDSTNNCNTALQDKLQVCESIVHIQCCLLTVPTIATLHYKTNQKFVNPLFIFNVVCWQYQQLQHYITRHTRSLWIHCSCQCCLLTVPTIATLHYKTH